MKKNEVLDKFEEMKKKFFEHLAVCWIILSFICFWCWLMFIVCFVFALGSRGSHGAIVESGVFMLRHHLVVSLISLIPAGYFVRILSKIG